MVSGKFKLESKTKIEFLYIVELKTGKKESAISRFSSDAWSIAETGRNYRLLVVCSYIIERNLVSEFYKEKLELSARVKKHCSSIDWIEFLIQSYKNYKSLQSK